MSADGYQSDFAPAVEAETFPASAKISTPESDSMGNNIIGRILSRLAIKNGCVDIQGLANSSRHELGNHDASHVSDIRQQFTFATLEQRQEFMLKAQEAMRTLLEPQSTRIPADRVKKRGFRIDSTHGSVRIIPQNAAQLG